MRFIVSLLLFVALLGGGCASVSGGRPINEAALAQIQEGMTTQAEAIALLGNPNLRRTRDGQTVLGWLHSTGRSRMIFSAVGESRYVELTFDASGILREILDNQATSTLN